MATARSKKPAAVKQRQNSGKRKKATPRAPPRAATRTAFGPGNPHAFKPGDPRINRNGRPRDHNQLRELIQQLAGEPSADVKQTRIEAMLLGMFDSSQPADRSNLLEHGWGKVPQAHKIGGDRDNPLVITGDDTKRAEAELTKWRKKMAEQITGQLSGLNVVPTPDISSTPTV